MSAFINVLGIVVAALTVAWLVASLLYYDGPRERRDPNDVFSGGRRFIHLPPGWTCDHMRWGWRELGRDEAEHVATVGLYVWTQHLETGDGRWREVMTGPPGYSEGRSVGFIPGSTHHETTVVALNSEGVPVVDGQLLPLEQAA